jgi:hypothetical protein
MHAVRQLMPSGAILHKWLNYQCIPGVVDANCLPLAGLPMTRVRFAAGFSVVDLITCQYEKYECQASAFAIAE